MARTLHRPPVGGETPDDLDLLEGIDLHGEYRRGARTFRTGALVVLAIVALLAAIIAIVLAIGGEPTTQEYPDSGHRPMTYDLVEQAALVRDSWEAPLVTAYHTKRLTTHDSWMGAQLEADHARLDALDDSGHRPVATRAGP